MGWVRASFYTEFSRLIGTCQNVVTDENIPYFFRPGGHPFLFLGRVLDKFQKALEAIQVDLATKLFYRPKISYFLPTIWINLFCGGIVGTMKILDFKINPMGKLLFSAKSNPWITSKRWHLKIWDQVHWKAIKKCDFLMPSGHWYSKFLFSDFDEKSKICM